MTRGGVGGWGAAVPVLFSMLLGWGWASSAWTGEEELSIQVKPLSQWLKQLQGENRGLQMRAARALAEAPQESRASIIVHLIPVLSSARENDKFVTAQILGDYGPIAKAAAPSLLPMLEGTQFERNRSSAAKALGQLLKDSPAGPEIDKVVAALMAKLEDPYSDVRREAIYACGMIGPAASACLTKVPPLLQEPPVGVDQGEGYLVRCATAWAVGRMGPAAASVIDQMIAVLQSDAHVNPNIAWAIGEIGPVNGNVVSNIVDKLERTGNLHDWGAFKDAAFKALERFGPKAVASKDYLKRILRETPNNRVTIEPLIAATRTLGAMGPAAADSLELLEKMKGYQSHPHAEIPQEKHDLLHREAEAALAKVRGQAAPSGVPK